MPSVIKQNLYIPPSLRGLYDANMKQFLSLHLKQGLFYGFRVYELSALRDYLSGMVHRDDFSVAKRIHSLVNMAEVLALAASQQDTTAISNGATPRRFSEWVVAFEHYANHMNSRKETVRRVHSLHQVVLALRARKIDIATWLTSMCKSHSPLAGAAEEPVVPTPPTVDQELNQELLSLVDEGSENYVLEDSLLLAIAEQTRAEVEEALTRSTAIAVARVDPLLQRLARKRSFEEVSVQDALDAVEIANRRPRIDFDAFLAGDEED